MDEVKRFVGIDFAKAALDVFIGSVGMAFSVANDEVGIRELLRQLKPADFVVLEATGGLETPVASALQNSLANTCAHFLHYCPFSPSGRGFRTRSLLGQTA